LKCGHSGVLRRQHDVVNLPLRGVNFPETGSVRVMSAAYREYSPAASIPQHPLPAWSGIVRIVKHRGVESRSHDWSVGRPLTAPLAHSYCIKAETSRSVTPGFTRCIAAKWMLSRHSPPCDQFDLAASCTYVTNSMTAAHPQTKCEPGNCWPASANPVRFPNRNLLVGRSPYRPWPFRGQNSGQHVPQVIETSTRANP